MTRPMEAFEKRHIYVCDREKTLKLFCVVFIV